MEGLMEILSWNIILELFESYEIVRPWRKSVINTWTSYKICFFENKKPSTFYLLIFLWHNLSLQHPVSFYKVTFDLKGWPLWYSMVALTTTFIDWEYELWLQTGSSGTLVMQLVKITNFINLKCELWPQTGTLLEPRCICSYKL
jgi:hypothetical protein